MFFVEDIIRNLTIGEDLTRVGVVLFSNFADVLFDLDDYKTSAEMILALQSVVYEGGNTNTSGLSTSLIFN